LFPLTIFKTDMSSCQQVPTGRTVLSIDFGTTNCKTAVIDERGNFLAEGYGSYPVHSPGPGKYEQDADEWKSTLVRCLRALGAKAKAVEVVSITGQGSTSVCLDSSGNVIGPVISHLDRRYFAEGAETTRFPDLGYVGTKMAAPLLWMKVNRPKDFRRLRRVLDVREYIGYLISGVFTYEASAFRGDLAKKFINLTGIEEGAMGEPHDNSSPIGTVTHEFSAASGLRAGTKVLLAPFDGLCSVVGVGVDRKGLLADIPGSTEVIAAPVDPGSALEVIPRALEDLSLYYTSPPLGLLYRWFRDQFYGTDDRSFSRMERDASKAPPGSGGVMCVPRVTYSHFFADYSMSLHNLSISTTREQIARAVNEGLVMYASDIVAKVASSGTPVAQVRVGAGGAASKLSNQLRADVYGIEVAVPHTLNVGCLGAAVYGFVSAGIHGRVTEAIPKMVRLAKKYEPDPRSHREYLKILDDFHAIISKMSRPSHAANI
jgi:xylulokinase